jgi:hypothetical protein
MGTRFCRGRGVRYQATGLLNDDDALAIILLQADSGVSTAGTATDDGDIPGDDVWEPIAGDDDGGGSEEPAGKSEGRSHSCAGPVRM